MWIQNMSRVEVPGYQSGYNTILVQIGDPASEFPTPNCGFEAVYQFEFLDLEASDQFAEEFKITNEQAQQLVFVLSNALENELNVVVHCTSGISRSGAVCEVGVLMGFEDTGRHRQPNLMVMDLMIQSLP